MKVAVDALVTELDIKLKRAYEPAAETDGTRILIDRLWPRGVTKTEAAIDHWFRDLSPSTELRKWFGHDPALFAEFRRRYTAELNRRGERLDELLRLASHGIAEDLRIDRAFALDMGIFRLKFTINFLMNLSNHFQIVAALLLGGWWVLSG